MYRCDATDLHGRKISGKGKGKGSEAVASALFEALEHYCLFISGSQALVRARLGEHLLDAEIIEGSPLFSLLSVRQAPPLSRVMFKGLLLPEVEIRAPAFLFDPQFKSSSARETVYLRMSGFSRYATNSGTAAGTTLEDAQLHALMELIERDALSIELLATVFAQSPKPVRRIVKESLSCYLRELVALVERETGGIVTIWHISSDDIHIPVILVRLTDPSDAKYGYFGSGASLYVDYAIERSLMEAVQGYRIYTEELSKPLLEGIEKLLPGSPYRRCLLEYGIFEYGGGERKVDFCTLVDDYSIYISMPIIEQINVAVNVLKYAGLEVYARTLFSQDIHVAQIYCPGLERFFLASAGVFVTPGHRGRRALFHAK